MKKSVLFLLPLYLLSFVSCKGSFKTNYKIVLKLNEDKNGLVWDAVEGADKYLIVENEGTPYYVEQPGYLFNTDGVETKVTVSAVIGDEFEESYIGTGTYKYIGYESGNMNLTYYGERGIFKITAEDFDGIDLLYKINDGEYNSIYPETHVILHEYGFHTFKIPKGVKQSSGEEPNIFYKEDKVLSYYVPLDHNLPAYQVIENGNITAEQLASKYKVQEQTPWGTWVDTDRATLSLNNSGIEGKCIEFKFKDDGRTYRFITDFSTAYAFSGFYFSARSTNAVYKDFYFIHTKEEEINGLTLPTFYISDGTSVSYSTWCDYTDYFEIFLYSIVDGIAVPDILSALRDYGFVFDNYDYLAGKLLPFCDTFSFEATGVYCTGEDISLYIDNMYIDPNR